MKLLSKICFLVLCTSILMVNAVTIGDIKVYAPKEQTIDEKIHFYADKYTVSYQVMRDVIKCESNFNPNAVGDGGHSRGLSQIFDSYHPEVTNEQAFDPDFAIEFLAKNIAKGKGEMWSCYRNMQ